MEERKGSRSDGMSIMTDRSCIWENTQMTAISYSGTIFLTRPGVLSRVCLSPTDSGISFYQCKLCKKSTLLFPPISRRDDIYFPIYLRLSTPLYVSIRLASSTRGAEEETNTGEYVFHRVTERDISRAEW